MVILLLLKHPYIARSVVDIFTKEVIRLHGIPSSVVTCMDALFWSNFLQELFKKQGTTLKISIAYPPRSNDQTKVLNITMERYLRCVQSNPNLGLSLSHGQNTSIIHVIRELPSVPYLK